MLPGNEKTRIDAGGTMRTGYSGGMRFSASRLLAGLAALVLISACADRFPSQKQRVWAYTKDNGLVREGMTRRQVYAVAEPVHVPRAYPPTFSSMIGIAFYSYHTEIHEFSGERVMTILYRRASTREYRSVPLHPYSLDELLYGRAKAARSVRSEENPRDVVHRVSAVFRKGEPQIKPGQTLVFGNESEGRYDEIFINPPHSSRRRLPSLSEFSR
jgi:hypothetical protein